MRVANSRVVMITGMHRSGTSLVASLCMKYGVDIGHQLMPPHSSNIRGHYEDLEFVQFHERVLLAAGLRSEGYCAWHRHLRFTPDDTAFARSLIDIKSKQSLIWGWKDPRSTLFLTEWSQLLTDPLFIFPFRDPAEVVASLLRRGEETFQDDGEMALREWLSYNTRLINFFVSKPSRCLLINCSSFHDKLHVNESHIQRFLNLSSDYSSSLFDSHLLSRDRHLPSSSQSSSLVKRCYHIYEQLDAYSNSSPRDFTPLKPHPSLDRVAIILPLHRLPLDPHERVSLAQLQYQLPHHNLILAKPTSLDVSHWSYLSVSFDDCWFDSVQTYSDLLLTYEFYDAFSDYEYILIHQLDALVMSADLLHWCDRDWDYVGAPWMHGFTNSPKDGLMRVGNGGFSLRRVSKFKSILATHSAQSRISQIDYYEDLFWSIDAPSLDPTFCIPDPVEACLFSAESCPRHIFRLNGNKLPFGCHYWNRIDPEFWASFLSPNALSEYHLRPYSDFDNRSAYDYVFLRRWVTQLVNSIITTHDCNTIGRILTFDLPEELLYQPPSQQGIRDVFDRILQREPNSDWLAFWVGNPNAKLLDIIDDLSNGPEFKHRIEKLMIALEHMA